MDLALVLFPVESAGLHFNHLLLAMMYVVGCRTGLLRYARNDTLLQPDIRAVYKCDLRDILALRYQRHVVAFFHHVAQVRAVNIDEEHMFAGF